MRLKKLMAITVSIILATYPMMATAFTVINLKNENYGSERMVSGTMVFDSSYNTGGESLLASQLGLSTMEEIIFQDSKGYTFDGIINNSKQSALIKAYRSGAGKYGPDMTMVTKPSVKLISNANCVTNLSANPLYGIERQTNASENILSLYSNNNGGASVMGYTDTAIVGPSNVRAGFWVRNITGTAGTQIYVSDTAVERLEYNSPTSTDGYIVMPFEDSSLASQLTMPGFGIAVKVYHNTTASDYPALNFDDNGEADFQLCFTDNNGMTRFIDTADIITIGPQYADANQSASGPEIQSGTDMSTITVDFIVTGH